MVVIDQLRISDDAKLMYIDVHVSDAEYFDNIYLGNVTILTADKVSENSSGTPTEDYIYRKDFSNNLKEATLVLDIGSITAAYNNMNHSTGTVIDSSKAYAKLSYDSADFSNNLFFIYITCTGSTTGCPPCTLDELTTVGITFDEAALYQQVMGYTKQLADKCTIPTGFIDFILLWNAFKSAVRTDHYIQAYEYYKLLFGTEGYGPYGNTTNSYTINTCGCRG